MFESDYLNDSSETINLYSSKKVADIYNAQLLNLINCKNSTLGAIGSTEQDANIATSNRNKCPLKLSDEKPIPEKQEDQNNSTINTSDVVELSDCSIDDSVEIVEEVDRPGVRRSARIRNKQKKRGRKTCYSDSTSNNANPVLLTKSKKKVKRKKGRQIDVEEVFADESLTEYKEELDDELNPEVSVKIIWKSVGIKKFKIRKFQKMSKIYQDLSQEENVPENQILLTFKGIKISQNDTPSSLNLQIYDFLEGGILSESANPERENVASENHTNNHDAVMLKFQDCNKKSVKIFLNKSDKMKVGMIKYSEQTEISLEKLKFLFDGELLDPCETPQTLGLDRDDIIDVKIM